LEGGHSGIDLIRMLVLSTPVFMFLSVVASLHFFCNDSHWLVPPSSSCPQGPKYYTPLFVVVANIVIIYKLLDMNTNLTYPPTLSYDKGIAYS
jgi:hypothetical protein